jgi:hypothetical protein
LFSQGKEECELAESRDYRRNEAKLSNVFRKVLVFFSSLIDDTSQLIGLSFRFEHAALLFLMGWFSLFESAWFG